IFFCFLNIIVMFSLLHDRAPTDLYSLSLHDALPIFVPSTLMLLPSIVTVTVAGFAPGALSWEASAPASCVGGGDASGPLDVSPRSEEHTSELQSLTNLVCRLLLAKIIIYARINLVLL